MDPSKTQYIFTPSAGKTGTTALAKWLIDNKLAINVVDGVKEPYLLLNESFNYSDLEHSALPHLDASVNYATDGKNIDRFPPNSLILFCLRNPLDRLYSHYKMTKIEILRPNGTSEYFSKIKGFSERKIADLHAKRHGLTPERASEVFQINTDLIKEQTFLERVRYEISFFLSRHQWPARSLIFSSTFNFQMKNLLRYPDHNAILPVSVGKLKGPILAKFAREYLNSRGPVGPIETVFSHKSIKLPEGSPDFLSNEFDFLREHFLFDLEQLQATMQASRINEEYICFRDLYKYFMR